MKVRKQDAPVELPPAMIPLLCNCAVRVIVSIVVMLVGLCLAQHISLGEQAMAMEDVRCILYCTRESTPRAGCDCVRERVVCIEQFENKRILEFEVCCVKLPTTLTLLLHSRQEEYYYCLYEVVLVYIYKGHRR